MTVPLDAVYPFCGIQSQINGGILRCVDSIGVLSAFLILLFCFFLALNIAHHLHGVGSWLSDPLIRFFCLCFFSGAPFPNFWHDKTS